MTDTKCDLCAVSKLRSSIGISWHMTSYLSSRSFRVTGLNMKSACLPPIAAFVVFLKVLLLVLYSSSSISPLSVPLFHLCHLTVTFMQMTLNFSSLFIHLIFILALFTSRTLYTTHLAYSWMTANLLTLNSCKTEFFLIRLKHKTALSAPRTLGFIFDEHLSFSDQITSLSKSCNFHIRQLRCIRPFLDFKTASIIATSIVHSKLDYCNSLYYNLPNSQLSRLQHIQNSLARAVVKAHKSSHITPILSNLSTG